MSQIELVKVEKEEEFPSWAPRSEVVIFLHENMKPYEDTEEDIGRGLDYALSKEGGKGGFLTLARYQGELTGVLVMLQTGMKGYVPENILLFVGVRPQLRGKGIGQQLIERSLAECKGDVKLHVEYDNPAMRLYKRVGFASKYAEMRYQR